MSDDVLREIEECQRLIASAEGDTLARIAREEHLEAEGERRVASEMCERADKAEAERDEALETARRTKSIHTEKGEGSCFAKRVELIKEVARLREALIELVGINEEWNTIVGDIIGKPPGWTDNYLDKARAALRGGKGET